MCAAKSIPKAFDGADKFGASLSPTGQSPGGTTGAKWYLDETGRRWVVKLYSSAERAKQELAAILIYRAAGVPAPFARGVRIGKQWGVASLEVKHAWNGWSGGSKLQGKMQEWARAGFVVDCLVRNWDVAGATNDNVIATSSHDQYPEHDFPPCSELLVRLDFGGCFSYRAGGKKKTGKYPTTVEELSSMLQYAGGKWLYGGASAEDMAAGSLIPSRKDLERIVMECALGNVGQLTLDRYDSMLPQESMTLSPVDEKSLEAAQALMDAVKKRATASLAEAEAVRHSTKRAWQEKQKECEAFFEAETMPIHKSIRDGRHAIGVLSAAMADLRRELSLVDADIFFIKTGEKWWSQHVNFCDLDPKLEAAMCEARTWLVQTLDEKDGSWLISPTIAKAPIFKDFMQRSGFSKAQADNAIKLVKGWANSSQTRQAGLLKAGLHVLLGNGVGYEAEQEMVGKAYASCLAIAKDKPYEEAVRECVHTALGKSADLMDLAAIVKAIAIFNQTWVEFVINSRKSAISKGIVDGEGRLLLARGMNGNKVKQTFQKVLSMASLSCTFEAEASVASSFSYKKSIASRFGSAVQLFLPVRPENVLVSCWAMGDLLYSGEHEVIVICPQCRYSFTQEQIKVG